MSNKWIWRLTLLGLAFLFRDRLLAMTPIAHEGISVPAVLIALIGGGFMAVVAYVLVTTLEIRDVVNVGGLIVFSGISATHFGHWLTHFPAIGNFWGGFVGGVLETAVLYGALYGAKEVWSGKEDT